MSVTHEHRNVSCIAFLSNTTADLHKCVRARLTVMDTLPVAFVMPLHPPKYTFLPPLGHSVLRCGVEGAFVPTFTSEADAERAAVLVPELFGRKASAVTASKLLTLPLVLGGRLPKSANVASYKKLAALNFCFTRSRVPFALAVDAEVAFVAFGAAHVWRTRLEAWSSARTVLASRASYEEYDLVKPRTDKSPTPRLKITSASCEALRELSAAERRVADRVATYNVWWADAPIFERVDWADFAHRLGIGQGRHHSNLVSNLVEHGSGLEGVAGRVDRHDGFGSLNADRADALFRPLALDHAAYMCYKVAVRGWTLVDVDELLARGGGAPGRGGGDDGTNKSSVPLRVLHRSSSKSDKWIGAGIEGASVTQQEQVTRRLNGTRNGFMWTPFHSLFRACVQRKEPVPPSTLLTFHIDRCHNAFPSSCSMATVEAVVGRACQQALPPPLTPALMPPPPLAGRPPPPPMPPLQSTCPSNTSGAAAAPPRVAVCITGSARSFASPLLLASLRHNLIAPLTLGGSAAVPAALFALLKTGDTDKGDMHSPNGFYHHSEATATPAALYAALGSRWLLPLLSEVVVLNGSGTYAGVGWQPSEEERRQAADASITTSAASAASPSAAGRGAELAAASLRQSDEQSWQRFHPAAGACRSLLWYTNSTDPLLWERLMKALLGIKWCGQAIERHEARHGVSFDLVAYTRPDLLRFRPLQPWCEFRHLRSAVHVCPQTGADGSWLSPRQHLHRFTSQPDAFASCKDNRTKQQVLLRHGAQPLPSCCFNGEALLSYVVHGLPQGGCVMTLYTSFLRSVARQHEDKLRLSSKAYRHVCGVALSDAYSNGMWATDMRTTMGGLPIETGVELRRLFGKDTKKCMLALAPFDKATEPFLYPTWNPFNSTQ